MSKEIREFVAGDRISVTTIFEHEANIAGITVYYPSEDEPHASYGALALSKGTTDTGKSPWGQSVPLPGPYLRGEVILESAVSLMQRQVAENGTITTIAGTSGTQGVNREKGPARKVWLNEPIGLFFDDDAGVLYIGDTFNARIRAVYLEAQDG